MPRQKKKSSFALPRIRPIGFTGILVEWTTGNTTVIEGSVRGVVQIKGQRNRIELQKGARFTGHLKIQGSDNVAIIGPDCKICAKIVLKGHGQTVSIGGGTSFQSGKILCEEGCNVTIGKAGMISRNVEIRTSDSHSLVDAKTGKRLNRAASVVIGDHVWIGLGTLINKGSEIPEDSVVGAMSFVNKKFEESGVVLAGTPAKVVRRGVTWHRGRQDAFTADKLDEWRTPSGQDTEPMDE